MVLDSFISSVTRVFQSWRKRKRDEKEDKENNETTTTKKQKTNYTITPAAKEVTKKRSCLLQSI